MCYWGTLALVSTVEYCLGLHTCKVDAKAGGYALGRSNFIEFDVSPNTEYVLFSDARDPHSVNASELEWSSGNAVTSVKRRATRFDPWLLVVFQEEARIKTSNYGTFSVASTKTSIPTDETISYGLCPAKPPPPWDFTHLVRFATLPLSRIRVQIWRRATVGVVWPLVAYPLVAASKRPLSGYIVLLDTLLVSDIFYWAGFGMAGLELADSGGFPEIMSIFVTIFCLSLLSLTVRMWYRNMGILVVLALIAPLWSSFYWTSLALLFGVFRKHINYK